MVLFFYEVFTKKYDLYTPVANQRIVIDTGCSTNCTYEAVTYVHNRRQFSASAILHT